MARDAQKADAAVAPELEFCGRHRKHGVAGQQTIHAPPDLRTPRAGSRRSLRGQRGCPHEAFPDTSTEIRVQAADPFPVRGPDLEGLDDAKVLHPGIEPDVGHVDSFAGPEQGFEARDGGRERGGRVRFRLAESVGTDQQTPRRPGRRSVGKQHAADVLK